MNHLLTVLLVLAVFAPSGASALEVDAKVPSFSAKTQDGRTVTDASIAGRATLFYFYPKDETPGCSTEAQGIRDAFDQFLSRGAIVYGVSRQGQESHRNFKKKHQLPFDLIADTDGKMAQAFEIDTWPIIGLFKRQSVLISPQGKVIRVYRDVDPSRHAREVLQDLDAIKILH